MDVNPEEDAMMKSTSFGCEYDSRTVDGSPIETSIKNIQ